jgi:hypothetical protein
MRRAQGKGQSISLTTLPTIVQTEVLVFQTSVSYEYHPPGPNTRHRPHDTPTHVVRAPARPTLQTALQVLHKSLNDTINVRGRANVRIALYRLHQMYTRWLPAP